ISLMNWIDFPDLPPSDSSFSSLFIDYVNDFQKVQNFYPGNFREPDAWRTTIDRVLNRKIDRSRLVHALTSQNRNFQCGVRTLANIDLLRNDNTLAVVTGQQVGMFTGPLYTIYKTLTPLKLVDSLASRYPEYTFVPVFWLAGEDHDYDEVSSITLITPSNDLTTITYGQPRDPDSIKQAVGALEFDDALLPFFSAIRESLIPTEFTEKVLTLFQTAYQKGMTFNRAFVHLMNDLLDNSGLVFLDPNDRDIKAILQPIVLRELRETPRLCQRVIDQSAALEKFYHAQVKPKAVNLFFFHNKGRFLIEPRPDGFALKGARRNFTTEELLGLAESQPELFSPNVVLRPVCQDFLLPTVAYVGGPAEIAYFAQLKTAYEDFGIPQPIAYPRASATILEDKVQKILARYSLPATDLFRDVEFTKQKVVELISDTRIDEVFGGTEASLKETLASLESGLRAIDPTLTGALDNARKKIDLQIEMLRQKGIAAQKRNHETALRQVEKAALHVFPRSNFQERELNVLHFLNKYGLEFLHWLQGELEIDRFKHQLIRME
ncbi:MAG: bacillithiol biosynthesis cysteine-adding enzyme BshC, partial [Bacteroidota bacterium]